jgi:anti-anti-sigma factor
MPPAPGTARPAGDARPSLTITAVAGAEPELPVVVHVVGEVDASTTHILLDALQQAISSSSGAVVVDCARWNFVDAAGLRTLAWLGDEVTGHGRLAVLRNLQPWMSDLLHRSGVDRHFASGMAGFLA